MMVDGGTWDWTKLHRVDSATEGYAASGFDIGSTVNDGTDKERNNVGNYSAARARTILSKTNLDANNTALNLDGDAITTTTACFVSSMPWKTGATDKLLGVDGRPTTANARLNHASTSKPKRANAESGARADMGCGEHADGK